MIDLSIDFETRAMVDLRDAGVYKYAEDPHTDIWCMAWAFGDEEPEIWTPKLCEHEDDCALGIGGEECSCPCLMHDFAGLPDRIIDHIAAGGTIRAWNAQFERVIWREIMVKRYGAPAIRDEQFVDTAADAAAMALPRALDMAAKVLGVAEKKDEDGYGLMMRMTRPRKVLPNGELVWWDVPDRLARLYEYCKQDVRVERAILKALRPLSAMEREVYLMDQRMNDRGIGIDLPLVHAAKEIVAEGTERANLVLREITRGEVEEVTQNGRLVEWLQGQSVDTDSVAKPVVRDLLTSDLAPDVRRVLELRAEAGRSSVAKLDSMISCACADSRARGLLLYHGASTGRWSGKLIQPQNFPRGEVDDIERFIPYVMRGDYEALDLFHPPIVIVLSMLRSMLKAREGHQLIGADYAAIEARVLNWLAGQDDILDLFRRGEDVYKYNAARLYNIPLSEVKKFPHRQTGKFQELGCGYQMGWKKAISAAKDVYGLTLDEKQAKEIVTGYRATHDKVVQFWNDLDDAAIEAVNTPGVPVTVGPLRNIKFLKAGSYLYLVLPSGRPLVYAAPRVVLAATPWGTEKLQVEISAVDSYTKKWTRQRMYGGLWAENVVQAASRDLMAEAMLEAEKQGYLPVLTVHDEVVAEVPNGFGSVQEFESILTRLPAWAEGCPIAAEGWMGERYRK